MSNFSMGRKSHTNVENHPFTIRPKFSLNCQNNFWKKEIEIWKVMDTDNDAERW
jgi:hypothetical protein